MIFWRFIGIKLNLKKKEKLCRACCCRPIVNDEWHRVRFFFLSFRPVVVGRRATTRLFLFDVYSTLLCLIYFFPHVMMNPQRRNQSILNQEKPTTTQTQQGGNVIKENTPFFIFKK
jgi:hypothetical protein